MFCFSIINLHFDGIDTTRCVPTKTGTSDISGWINKGLDIDEELENKMILSNQTSLEILYEQTEFL